MRAVPAVPLPGGDGVVSADYKDAVCAGYVAGTRDSAAVVRHHRDAFRARAAEVREKLSTALVGERRFLAWVAEALDAVAAKVEALGSEDAVARARLEAVLEEDAT